MPTPEVTWLLASPWLVVLVFVTYRYRTRRPRLDDYAPTSEGPPLSVVIPARNESRNIEACVRSVLASAYRPLEVIVVDDQSTDGTAEAVARLASDPAVGGRVRLVRGAPLPDGWFGKPWALAQGYEHAAGAVLVFTDADTRHTPELIPRAYAVLRREQVDLVSVVPRQVMESFWERVVQPQMFVALQTRVGDLRRVNRTRRAWDAIANGQFMLTTREAYEAVGTHAAVRDSVAEDMALAQTYVRRGRDLFLLHAPGAMRTRMYRSLREIVEGWSKNLAVGVPLTMPPIPLLRRAAPYLMWLPALFWIVPPIAWLTTGAAAAALACALSLATWIVVYREERGPPVYAVLYPLGALVVALIMMRSAVRGGRRVEWRGRVYRGVER